MMVLFSFLFLLGVLAFSAYRFYQQMRQLDDIRLIDEDAFSLPTQEAFLKLLDRQAQDYRKEIHELSKTLSETQHMVQLWAHQLKVPLAALSLMQQTDQLNKEDVGIQLLELENNVANLLNFMKFTGHASDFRFEVIALETLVKNIIKSYRLVFIQKHISFSLKGQAQVLTDAKWLQFALTQIIDNALKYSPPGAELTILITEESIVITDQGIGIQEEDLPRLFDHGFTGFNGRRYRKATGLGLYMTKTVLDQLGIVILVESQVEVGTRVTLKWSQRGPVKD
ncbi:Signal transduction histidine kinase [Streptococcus sp. DD12]|nr:Signal transduction histidine kinase [Streptococcus sp. DD12]